MIDDAPLPGDSHADQTTTRYSHHLTSYHSHAATKHSQLSHRTGPALQGCTTPTLQARWKLEFIQHLIGNYIIHEENFNVKAPRNRVDIFLWRWFPVLDMQGKVSNNVPPPSCTKLTKHVIRADRPEDSLQPRPVANTSHDTHALNLLQTDRAVTLPGVRIKMYFRRTLSILL